MCSRRSFLRTGSLAVIGSIFVPKYERWFRPNGSAILQPFQYQRISVPLSAAMYGPDGKEKFRAALESVGERMETTFPTLTTPFTADKVAILDAKGNELYWWKDLYPNILMPGDQPVLRVPKINFLED